jgi:hypothetical protein
MIDPVPSRPQPAFLGAANELEWDWARERLENERNFWLVTSRSDGWPQARPVWGLWTDEGLFLSKWGLARTVHRPEMPGSVHVDSAAEVVIVEGVIDRVGPSKVGEVDAGPTLSIAAEREKELAERFLEKYGQTHRPTLNVLVRPRVVYAWREGADRAGAESAGKWTFPPRPTSAS